MGRQLKRWQCRRGRGRIQRQEPGPQLGKGGCPHRGTCTRLQHPRLPGSPGAGLQVSPSLPRAPSGVSPPPTPTPLLWALTHPHRPCLAETGPGLQLQGQRGAQPSWEDHRDSSPVIAIVVITMPVA